MLERIEFKGRTVFAAKFRFAMSSIYIDLHDLPNAAAKWCKNLTGYAAVHGVTLSNSCFNTCGLASKDLAHSIYAIVIPAFTGASMGSSEISDSDSDSTFQWCPSQSIHVKHVMNIHAYFLLLHRGIENTSAGKGAQEKMLHEIHYPSHP